LEKGEGVVVAEMREHLKLLRERGVDPYPRRCERTHLSSDIVEQFDELKETEVAVAGRITAIRGHGKAAFADLVDAGGKIQLYLKRDDLGDDLYGVWKLVDVGDIVGARGEVFETRTGEKSVKVSSFTLLSKALRPLPEKWHGLQDKELRYRQRYLDLIANEETRRAFLTRSRMIEEARAFLAGRGFVEVETPVLQPIYGGAFARPFVTHHHSLDMPLYLRIADELYLKRLIVGGIERVFEIGKDFRNEGMDRTHSPEFTQLELYQAYTDYHGMMEITESLIVALAERVLGGMVLTWQGTEIDLTPPWRRVSVAGALGDALGPEALKDAASLGGAAEAAGIEVEEPRTFGRVAEKVLDELVQPTFVEPTFLIDYPREISPLAKETPDDPDIVERFEVFIGGLELGNSFTELNDPEEQRRRLEAQVERRAGGDEEAHGMDEDFVRALEHGMPPTGGLGIGFDRLVMLFTDSPNIRDVILFPPMRPEDG
jgi:lysyl-tRNA synthetase class 2